MASDDGSIEFAFHRCPAGVIVVKNRRDDVTATLEQALLLRSVGELRKWLKSEPIRFRDPMLYERLCREGDRHWQGGQ